MRPRLLAVIALVALTAASCHHKQHSATKQEATQVLQSHIDKQQQTNRTQTRRKSISYTPDALVGHWQHKSEHQVFYADSTGRYWDTADDVSEAEAQQFVWLMQQNTLAIAYTTIYHAIVPRDYSVTMLDTVDLIYTDAHGSIYTWSKVR